MCSVKGGTVMFHADRIFLPTLVLIISVLLVGCGKGPQETAPEKRAPQETGIKVKIHMEGEQGKTTIVGEGKVAIPPEFPADIMIYPNTEVREAIMAESGDSCFIRLEARESREKIVSAYKERMKAEGWKETAASTSGNTVLRDYAKDKRTVTLAVSETGRGKAEIQIQLVIKR